MIAANVYDRSRAEICRLWLRGCPQTGDILWIEDGKPGRSMTIARVEHVCDPKWKPDINLANQPPHSLIIHVEPR